MAQYNLLPQSVRIPQAGGQGLVQGIAGPLGDWLEERPVREARRTLANLGQSDPVAAANQLLAAGDIEGARTLANLGLAQEDRKFRQMQYEQGQQVATDERNYRRGRDVVSDQQADRRYALDERNSAARGLDIRTITNRDGTTSSVRVNLATGEVQPLNIPGGSSVTPANPYATGKFNEGQGKAASFADRMAEAEAQIMANQGVNEGIGGAIGNAANQYLSPAITNQFNSPQRQQFEQAQRNFINAVLRRESGAVITEQEFANARQQYFPQPGDSPEVIEQKRQNRMTATAGLMREAGPSYRPPQGWGAPQQTVAQQPRAPQGTSMGVQPAQAFQGVRPGPDGGKNQDRAPQGNSAAVLQQARAAIQAGAPRDAVIQRLIENGIDPAGL